MTAKAANNGNINISALVSLISALFKKPYPKKIEYYTFTFPTDCSLKAVYKGVPTDIPDDEFVNVLSAHNFFVKYVCHFGTSTNLFQSL